MFFEEGGYRFAPMITGREDGQWEASVLFEKNLDRSRDRVPAIRHKLRTLFSSSEEAMRASTDYGYSRIRQGDVGLPKGSTLEATCPA
ncbi:MAG: hypothetical protein V4488_26475 [Pseudomonadota bacterium]